jgi:hypothetical protein
VFWLKTRLNAQLGRKIGVFRSQLGTPMDIQTRALFLDFSFFGAFKHVFERFSLLGIYLKKSSCFIDYR